MRSGNKEAPHLFCVDMQSNKVIFKKDVYGTGEHTHHWITHNGTHYLSVQSKPNVISFFAVDPDAKSFVEDESMKITLADSDELFYCEYDRNFKNIYMLTGPAHMYGKRLEQRAVS